MAHGDAPMGNDTLLSRAMSVTMVDKRIVEAIIRAVYNYDSLILKYSWVEDELRALVSDDEEYGALEEKMYELIANREIKNVRIIYYHPDSIGDSVVAVAPCALAEEQWQMLERLAELYDYADYEDPSAYKHDFVAKHDRPSLDFVLHNLIRAWCAMTFRDNNALAVYKAFKLEKSFQEIVGEP